MNETHPDYNYVEGPWTADECGPFAAGGDNRVVEAITPDGKLVRREICYLSLDTNDDDEDHEKAMIDLANLRLIAAAPAYTKAWGLVPDAIKGRIFDALHKPDTEWVEAAIRKAEGAS